MADSLSSCDPPEVVKATQKSELNRKYEYLDHPADIQVHACILKLNIIQVMLKHLDSMKGGDTLAEAYEQAAMGMFGYMTELDTVQEERVFAIAAEGHDLESLLYNYLDEFLFNFCADPFFIPKRVRITEFDKKSFRIKADGFGETFDLKKHPQGTEVKAITYSNMQVYDSHNRHELYVILDI